MNRLPNWPRKSITFLFQTILGYYITSALSAGFLYIFLLSIIKFYDVYIKYIALLSPLFFGTTIFFILRYLEFRKKYLPYSKTIMEYDMLWDPITKFPYCPKCKAFMEISAPPDAKHIPNFFVLMFPPATIFHCLWNQTCI